MVDFGSKKRQKPSPIQSPNLTFSLSILWQIFDEFRYHVLVAILVNLGSNFEPTWGTFSHNFLDYMLESRFLDF